MFVLQVKISDFCHIKNAILGYILLKLYYKETILLFLQNITKMKCTKRKKKHYHLEEIMHFVNVCFSSEHFMLRLNNEIKYFQLLENAKENFIVLGYSKITEFILFS